MSSESYRILEYSEVQKYENCNWFFKEAINVTMHDGIRWLVPEKRLTKELDKKNYFQSKLQELLDEFDFDRVHQVMEVLNWHWAGTVGIPNKSDMIPLVKGLYESIESRILEGIYAYTATGGFKLTYNPDEDDELSLVFEAETYSVYGD